MSWMGVDGGGTKTEVLVVDHDGVRALVRGQASNHQGVGLDGAVHEIAATIQRALSVAERRVDDMDGVVLGLAGADFPEDVQALTQGLADLFGKVPYRVVNDAEIALDAGTSKGWGIAAVAGTGSNVFGRSPEGVTRQVGGLGFEYGDYGSGIDIARDVLHAAFRSAESRGPRTTLEGMVLTSFGQPDFPSLSRAMYQRQIPDEAFLVLAPVCFSAASAGDAVAIDILERQGHAIADSVAGCAHQLRMTHLSVDVVLAGSLWLGQAPHMKEALYAALAQKLPLATVSVTELRPVAGAVLMAAHDAGSHSPVREILASDRRLRGVE